MANKYYNVDKSPYHTSCYFITSTEDVCKAVSLLPKKSPFSYQMLYPALFGMKPDDFYKYIQTKYNAKVVSSKNSVWKTITFSNLADAWELAKELDRRFIYCVQNHLFEE